MFKKFEIVTFIKIKISADLETSSYIYIHPKQMLTHLKIFFFIHGIKYITNVCKLITKSSRISCFSRPNESSIECTEQDTRHQVKLNTKVKGRAVSNVLQMDYLKEGE